MSGIKIPEMLTAGEVGPGDIVFALKVGAERLLSPVFREVDVVVVADDELRFDFVDGGWAKHGIDDLVLVVTLERELEEVLGMTRQLIRQIRAVGMDGHIGDIGQATRRIDRWLEERNIT